MVGDAVADLFVDDIFSKDPDQDQGWGDDKIDPAGVVGVFAVGRIGCASAMKDALVVVGIATLAAKARFSEGRDFRMGAVDGGPEEGLPAGIPVAGLIPTDARLRGRILNLNICA